MRYEAINFGKKFKLFDEQWKPKVIAEMNDYQFKIVRLEGDFLWHDHKDTRRGPRCFLLFANKPMRTRVISYRSRSKMAVARSIVC
jgi:hypothetical protein